MYYAILNKHILTKSLKCGTLYLSYMGVDKNMGNGNSAKLITFRMPDDMLEQFNQFTKEHQENKSALIKKAINLYMQGNSKKPETELDLLTTETLQNIQEETQKFEEIKRLYQIQDEILQIKLNIAQKKQKLKSITEAIEETTDTPKL